MSRNIDIYAICPFFIDPPGSAGAKNKVEQNRIRCEGLINKGKIMLDFPNAIKRESGADDFCRSYCWKGCPIAQIINEYKYPEESNDPVPSVKPSPRSFKIGQFSK